MCMETSAGASSLPLLHTLLAWRRRGGAEKRDCGSEIWHLHSVLHRCCAAKAILALWRYMVNSFSTNVKARLLLLNTEKAEGCTATGLGFQHIPCQIICSRALTALWSQRKCVLPNSAMTVCMAHTTDQTAQ